ncbi:MAG: hypothetical protein AMXMBFR34_30120 [Myxococcaceae bacterium]
MAQVYLAEHQTIGRKLAVKVLKADVAAQSEWGQRFIAEAQVVAALKHRNVVEVFDFGTLPDGRQFIMMEYVEGESLDAYVAKHAPLAPAIALDFADQILNALGEAHKKGIVHRDLKPGNVMLVREHNNETLLKVLDFGLARQGAVRFNVAPGQQSDKASLLAGTPAYVAPEQALGEVVDGRADLYALGVMLFEMLSGRLPFEAADDFSLVQMQVSAEAPPLDQLVSNLPDGVTRLVASLLAKKRDERPASADVARQAVHRIQKQLRADATAVRPMPRSPEHRVPTQKLERPEPPEATQAPTTDLSLAAKPSPWPKRFAALAAVLLIASATWALWPGAPPPVEPLPLPVAVEPPPEVSPPLPLEVPTPPVQPPAVVEPEKQPVEVGKGKPPKSPAPPAPACEPSERWRKASLAQLADLGTLASKRSVAAGVWFEQQEGRISAQVRAATTPSECAATEVSLARLQKDLEKR